LGDPFVGYGIFAGVMFEMLGLYPAEGAQIGVWNSPLFLLY